MNGKMVHVCELESNFVDLVIIDGGLSERGVVTFWKVPSPQILAVPSSSLKSTK